MAVVVVAPVYSDAMRRFVPIFLLVFPILVAPSLDVTAHSPEDVHAARADLRIDEQRGLRVRMWFEVPQAAKLAQGDADAAVSELAGCLQLTLGGESLAGNWRAGNDPKHGLSNGSHRLFALEYEPAEAPAVSTLDVTLVVGCFPEKDLSFSATARARSPWRVKSETLPASAQHAHDHSGASETGSDDFASRTLRVVFSRQSM